MKRLTIAILSSLYVVEVISPLASAKYIDNVSNVGVETKKDSLTLVENPFPDLKEGYLLDSQENYLKSIETIYKKYNDKVLSLQSIVKELIADEKEFKNFCNEILTKENVLIYCSKWREKINYYKSKLEEYCKKIDDSMKTAKELVLLIESYKCFGIDDQGYKTIEELLQNVYNYLNILFANKHYCNSWLDYAKKNSDLSTLTISSINNYPSLYDSMMETRQKFDSWYKNLFTNKK